MVIKEFLSILIVLISLRGYSQLPTDSLNLVNLFTTNSDLGRVLNNSQYRVQIHYTPVVNKEIRPSVQIGTQQFFYPASTVKLPIALLALQKMKTLGLDLNDRVSFVDSIGCGSRRYIDKYRIGKPSFKELLSEMIVVSDNDAYNALYQFVTPKYIINELERMGYNSSRIFRSFTGCQTVELSTNPVIIYDNSGQIKLKLYSSILEVERDDLFCEGYDKNKRIGAKNEKDGKIEIGPFDFNYGLEIETGDLSLMMQRLFYPEKFNPDENWAISIQQREAMLDWLKMIPAQLDNPVFKDRKRYPDDLYKYTYSSVTDRDTTIQIYSKLGLSYGFTTEVAYISKDSANDAFFLVVSVYTNANKIVNDGKYEYESIARPFISRLTALLVERL